MRSKEITRYSTCVVMRDMPETEFGFVLGVLSTFEEDIHTEEIIDYVVVQDCDCE